jgi:hypothetical protein
VSADSVTAPRVILRAVRLPDPPTPCECLCATWAHQDCTGEGDTPVTVVRGRPGGPIRVCAPRWDDLAQRIPASARRAA